MTTKDKINEALGLSGGKSIDEMLEDLSLKTSNDADQLDDLSLQINSEMEKVDEQIKEANETSSLLKISNIDASMKEVEDLIIQSKQVYEHIVNNVLASELIDAELIGALAKVLESIHINIAEFISLYRDKQKFIEKIKLMIFSQNQKKELMELKQKHTIELLKLKESQGAIDTEASESSSGMSQEAITKMLAGMSNSQLDAMISNNLSEENITEKEKE